ncbi:unnamed protein product [Lactuca saligna]|uniref:Uncharacterized protein n=1 Tax=Lactuca saligna TaxID=75948 RepID=A0AA35ZLE8_LACSI|nr:unnamed protein product [Lactuca saligna]
MVLYPYTKDDKVEPHTPETESDYDPTILISHLKKNKSPLSRMSSMTGEFGGEQADNLPYPNSSSHDDPVEHTETQEEDTVKLDLSLEIVDPLPLLLVDPFIIMLWGLG